MLVIALQIALSQVLPTPAPPLEEGPWLGVAGAPSGAVVVWGGDEVRWSADGSAFTPALRGRGHVEAAALDEDGALYVARGGRLGVRSPDGAERWSRLGDADTTGALVVLRGQVVRVATRLGDGMETYGTFFVSRDGGRRFAARERWPVGNFALVLALSDAGVLHLVTGYEAACGGGYQVRRHARLDDAETVVDPWPIDAPVDQVVAPSGWAYAPDACDGEGYAVCAVSPTGALRSLADARELTSDPRLVGASEGGRTWLALDDRVVIVQAERSELLARAATPAEPRALAVAAGRPWLLAGGHLHQLEAGTWRRVDPR